MQKKTPKQPLPPPHGAAGTGALPLPSPAALPSQQRPGPWSPGSSLPSAVVGKAAAAAADGDEDEWDEGFQEEQEDPKTAQHEEEEEEEEEEGEEEEENVSPPKKPSSSSRPASAASAASSSAGDLTCAICLDAIPLEDLATVPGCEHAYCAACIVGWAVASSPADASGSDVCGKCPQCKREYASVATHRRLDGTLSDYPVEESVCLLRRARWFCAGAGAAVAAAAAAAAARPRSPPMAPSDIDQADRIHANGGGIGGSGSGRTYSRRQHYYDDDDDLDDDDLDDDDESFYFSAAAGSARVVLGNRRWGEHGYVAAGRMRARPSRNHQQQQLQQRQKQLLESKGKGKAAAKNGNKGKAPGAAAASPSPSAAAAGPSTGEGSSSSSSAASASAPVAINSKGKAPAVLAVGCGAGGASFSSLDNSGGARFGSFVPGSSFDAVAGTSAGAMSSSAEKGRRARRAEKRAALGARQQHAI